MTQGPLLPTYLGGPPVTTENCDREPIHLPGSVQPHGALLVVEAERLQVTQASENLRDFLGISAQAALALKLPDVLRRAGWPADTASEVLAALPPGVTDALQFRTVLSPPAGGTGAPLALTAHRVTLPGAASQDGDPGQRAAGPDRLILELEVAQPGTLGGQHRLRNALFAMEGAATLLGLAEMVVEAVRDLSGFDRVMLYRFAPDDSGEVIAERRREDLPPFVGHRFPESDIPAQARALYVRHLLRLTADAGSPASALVPRTDLVTGQPVPLGGAVLRATSPMHVQYLKNMGVASSLSVSIVVEGRLWGLISCHHTSPFVTSPELRGALEELGRLLNLQVRLKEQAEVDAFRAGLEAGHRRALDVAAGALAPLTAVMDPAVRLRDLLGAGGLAAFSGGGWQVQGTAPGTAVLDALLDWLRASAAGPLYATDHLAGAWPGAADGALTGVASGMLALSIGAGWREALLWFRPEAPRTDIWGGATPEHAKDTLGPRRSFAAYADRVSGHALPWHPGEVQEARALGATLTAMLGERVEHLRAVNAALERSVAEWRKLAFVFAHDLQEPVRLISQFVGLFQLRHSGTVDPQTQQLLDFMTRESGRLQALTADLYTYTELLSSPAPRPVDVDLPTLLAACCADLSALIRSRDAHVTLPETGTVRGDPERLGVALTQLLRNALTFSAAPAHIEVQVVQEAGSVSVTVADRGPGIAPEYHERIFELFQRLGPRGEGSNGVGLPVARKIAEQHGGTLTVRSAPAQGSRFTLTLPAAEQ